MTQKIPIIGNNSTAKRKRISRKDHKNCQTKKKIESKIIY